MNTRWIPCVVILLCAAPAFCQVSGQSSTAPGPRGTFPTSPMAAPGPAVKWDYSVQTKDEIAKLGGGQLRAGLNKLGEEGWELVSVEPRSVPPAEAGSGSTFYFKRARGHLPMAGMPMGGSGLGAPPAAGGVFGGGGVGGGTRGNAGGRGGAGPMPPRPDEQFQIYRLKYAKAVPTAKVLKELYDNRSGLRCVSDERTNSLILAGADEQLVKVECFCRNWTMKCRRRRGRNNAARLCTPIQCRSKGVIRPWNGLRNHSSPATMGTGKPTTLGGRP